MIGLMGSICTRSIETSLQRIFFLRDGTYSLAYLLSSMAAKRIHPLKTTSPPGKGGLGDLPAVVSL
jgi:hypothetical protein